ncbi:MAG: hypothetical protein ACFB10_22855 [Salibacteraceae bacterium]
MAAFQPWKQWVALKQVAGIEAVKTPDGWRLGYCLLRKSGKGIQLEKSQGGFHDLESLLAELDKNIPLRLVLNGSGILHRPLESTSENDPGTLLRKVLPDANAEEFWVFTGPGVGASLVSLCRQSLLEDWHQQCTAQGRRLIGAWAGPGQLNALLGNLIELPEHRELGYHELQITDHRVSAYRTLPEPVPVEALSVGDQIVPGELIMAFAAGLSAFFPPYGPEIEALSVEWEESEQQRIFQFAGWGILLFFLVLVMGNFFLFEHFDERAAELEFQENQQNQQTGDLKRMKEEIDLAEAFMTRLGLLQPNTNSYYADRLSASLDNGLQFTRLEVNPLKRKVKQGVEELSFATGTLQVAGTARNSSRLNDWLAEVRDLNWVADVNILNYQQNPDIGAGEFLVELQLK